MAGCPGPVPKRITWIPPDLKSVDRPYPAGVVILEASVNVEGQVVSVCVLRGIRSDFDKAAQNAVLHWRFLNDAVRLNGKPLGVVMTVTVCTPDRKCER
jgi:hypothetical protein